jgi:hypothetical protein
MPFKSESQRRFMYARHPSIAKRWTKKYGTQEDLPERVSAFHRVIKRRGR